VELAGAGMAPSVGPATPALAGGVVEAGGTVGVASPGTDDAGAAAVAAAGAAGVAAVDGEAGRLSAGAGVPDSGALPPGEVTAMGAGGGAGRSSTVVEARRSKVLAFRRRL